MSDYTKVTIKKTVAEQGKIQAAAENRTLANYVEHLILSAGATAESPTPEASNKLGEVRKVC